MLIERGDGSSQNGGVSLDLKLVEWAQRVCMEIHAYAPQLASLTLAYGLIVTLIKGSAEMDGTTASLWFLYHTN